MPRRARKFRTFSTAVIACLLVVICVVLWAGVVVDMQSAHYSRELANRLSQRFGQPVHIADLQLSWNWHGPALRLDDVSIGNEKDGQTAVHAQAVDLHFALVDLIRGRLLPSGISLKSPHITALLDANGQIRIHGLKKQSDHAMNMQQIATLLDRVRFIQISNGRLDWAGGGHLPTGFQLSHVSLDFRNSGNNHHLQAAVTLPPAYGGTVRTTASARGDLGHPVILQGHATLHATHVSAARWLRLAGLTHLKVHGGDSDVKISGRWQGKTLLSAVVNLRAGDMQRPGGHSSHTLHTAMNASIDVKKQAQGYLLTLDTLDDSQARGTLTVDPADGTARGTYHNIPAAILLAWAKLAGPQPLLGWQAKGNLPQLQLHYDSGAGNFKLNAQFAGLTIKQPSTGKVLTGLDGKLSLSPDAGQLQVHTPQGGDLTWPPQLQGTLPVQTLQANVRWTHGPHGWQVKADKLQLTGANATVAGSVGLQLPRQGTPVADIQLQAKSSDVTTLLSHLSQSPKLALSDLRQWLAQAFQAGQLDSSHLTIRGPLDQFPFDKGGGQLKVRAKLHGVKLAYLPDWPALDDAAGSLTLDGKRLTVHADKASMLGILLKPASVRIKDVSNPVLKIDGGTRTTDIAKLLAFLPASPLADKFDHIAQSLDVSGPARLGLDLSVPLASDVGQLAVDGQLHLEHVSLEQAGIPYPIRDISGLVHFDQQGLHAKHLHANMAGLPLTIALQPGHSGELDIKATATMALPDNAAALKAFVPQPILDRAQGKTTAHMQLSVSSAGHLSGLSISSYLNGMALNLPAPLGKPTKTKAPLVVNINNTQTRVTLDYNHRLNAKLHLRSGQLQSANLVFGGKQAPATDKPGLWVSGTIAQADAGAWRHFLAAFDDPGATGSMPALGSVHLKIQGLRLGRLQLKPVTLWVPPPTDSNYWQLDLSGPGAKGTIQWLQATSASSTIKAQFAHLNFMTVKPEPASEQQRPDDSKHQPVKPADFPALSLHSQKLTINGKNFGHWNIEASRISSGIKLTQFRVTGGLMDGTASGFWIRNNGWTTAAIAGQFKGSGFGSLLQAAGYANALKAKNTHLKANLHIKPNAAGLTPDTLDGTLSVRFDNGQLLSVNPGAGRFLGLLNVYALPRRLFLDFGDVVDKGMSFDTIKGDFTIRQGNAHTSNFLMETPSVKVTAKGNIGLATKTYNEHLKIVPKLSSGVAIASTVLGGPIVGAVVLLTEKLLEKPIQELSAIRYHLTGSWAKPTIEDATTQE